MSESVRLTALVYPHGTQHRGVVSSHILIDCAKRKCSVDLAHDPFIKRSLSIVFHLLRCALLVFLLAFPIFNLSAEKQQLGSYNLSWVLTLYRAEPSIYFSQSADIGAAEVSTVPLTIGSTGWEGPQYYIIFETSGASTYKIDISLSPLVEETTKSVLPYDFRLALVPDIDSIWDDDFKKIDGVVQGDNWFPVADGVAGDNGTRLVYGAYYRADTSVALGGKIYNGTVKVRMSAE